MKRSRKPLFVALALALAMMATAACSGSEDKRADSGDSGTKLQMILSQPADSPVRSTLAELIKDFSSETGIAIDLLPASNQTEADLKVRMSAGNLTDIFTTHGWSIPRYKNVLVPLTDEPWAKDVNPTLDATMRDKDGGLYAYPAETDLAGLIVNSDVLKKSGIEPYSIKSWEDFDKACQAVLANGVTPIVVAGKEKGPSGNLPDWIAPGIYTPEELKQQASGDFQTKAYARVASLIKDWTHRGYINKDFSSSTSDDMARALAEGRAAFGFRQNLVITNALGYSPKAPVTYIPIPTDGKSDPYMIGGEGLTSFGISKTSKHIDAAKKFLKFLAEPDHAAKLAESTGNPAGLVTAHPDLGSLQKAYDYVQDNKVPLVPYWDRAYLPNGMWMTLVNTTDAIITGQGDVNSVTKQMHTDFDSLFHQNG